uniref:Ubiquitin-like domain-containing protein n=1 Tax=Chenopodium quinoa TaxID=63459 RepID=A0A803LMN7_CHEQI
DEEQTFANNNNIRKLLINIPTNPELDMIVDANAGDTAKSVKYMIANKLGCYPYSYDLMHNGRLLPPRATLDILDIDTNSTLFLVDIPQDLVWISVYTPNNGKLFFQLRKLQTVGYAKLIYPFPVSLKMYMGRTVTLNVLASDDVGNIHQRMLDQHGIVPPSGQHISFQGRRLVVRYSLASYGIKKDSLLKIGRPLKRTVVQE